MTMWQFMGIYFFGVLSVVAILYIIKYYNSSTTCTTCEKSMNDKNPLVQCTECKKWFCSSNHERIEESYTSGGGTITFTPANRTPEQPCGVKYYSMGELDDVRCNKHSKRFPYRITYQYKE